MRFCFFVASACLFVLWALPPHVSAQDAGSKIHLILAADIDSQNIGLAVREDAKLIRNFFEKNVPGDILRVTDISTEDMTEKGILQTINRLPFSGKDTVIFYYSGHAGYFKDPKTQQDVYCLSIPAKKIPAGGFSLGIRRNDVMKALLAKNPRLACLISDCCAVKTAPPSKDSAQERKAVSTLKLSPLFKKMFLESSGVVDITSSQKDLPSYTLGDIGSYFSVCFFNVLTEKSKEPPSDWNELFRLIQAKTSEKFKADYPKGKDESEFGLGTIHDQRPMDLFIGSKAEWRRRFEPPPPSPSKKVFLGVEAIRTEKRDGVRVTKVLKGHHGAKAGLEVGDVIVRINDRNIRDEIDYSKAVDAATGSTMTLHVRDVRGTGTVAVKIKLN